MKREGDLSFQPTPIAERPVRILKPYEAEDAPEMMRAKAYWRERLQGEDRIETPMHPDCKLSIVVPVFNEDVRRLARQLASFRAQTNIKPTEFEIIYVINNDEDDGSERALAIRAKNIHTTSYLRQDHGLVVHVIDKSSPGKTIPKCNVGKARNRGVAEAGVRFYEQGKNGILFQTDADTWLENPEHLISVCELFESDATVIGASGGVIFQWDPDTKDKTKRADLEAKIERFFRLRQYYDMRDFLLKPGVIRYPQGKRFSGANVMSRSLELAMVGGIDDAPKSGSSNFGLRLEEFASLYDQQVVDRRQQLKTVTALRESDRTGSSFKNYFDRIETNQDLRVPDVFSLQEDLPTFRERFYTNFHDAFEARDANALKSLLSIPTGQLLISEQDFEQLWNEVIGKRTIRRFRDFLRACNRTYRGKKTILEILYEQRPVKLVDLDSSYLQNLRYEVANHRDGTDLLRRMDEYYAQIRFGSETSLE